MADIEATPAGRLKRPRRPESVRARARLAKKVEATGGADDLRELVSTPASRSFLERDDKVTDVLNWYLRGFRRPSELAQLVDGVSEAQLRTQYLPAIHRRLARGFSQDELDERLTVALAREEGMLRYAWNEMLRAGKPGLKVQWAQVIQGIHANIAKLQGLHGLQRDTKVYLVAINAFLTEVADIAASTNDPALMQRVEHALEKFTRTPALVARSQPVDAEFTELPAL